MANTKNVRRGRCPHRPGGAQSQNCTMFGENVKRPVGADDPVRPWGNLGFVATYRKNERVPMRVDVGIDPYKYCTISHWCVRFSRVHPAGRTGSSAPTGVFAFALVYSNLHYCTAGRGRAPPLRYDETRYNSNRTPSHPFRVRFAHPPPLGHQGEAWACGIKNAPRSEWNGAVVILLMPSAD